MAVKKRKWISLPPLPIDPFVRGARGRVTLASLEKQSKSFGSHALKIQSKGKSQCNYLCNMPCSSRIVDITYRSVHSTDLATCLCSHVHHQARWPTLPTVLCQNGRRPPCLLYPPLSLVLLCLLFRPSKAMGHCMKQLLHPTPYLSWGIECIGLGFSSPPRRP